MRSPKLLLRRYRATPRLPRATFAGADVVADGAERPETGAGACQAQTAAKFEANHETNYELKPLANLGTNRGTNHGMNHGTTALTAATVRDAAGRTRDSSDQRQLLVPVAT